MRFISQANEIIQENVISGLSYGPAYSEQWGLEARATDFADVKADVEALLAQGSACGDWQFEPSAHVALHPGQAARILREGQEIGWLGALHPNIIKELELTGSVYLFELRMATLQQKSVPIMREISRFPMMRRDLAVVVDEGVPVRSILDTAREAAGGMLQDARIFDIYRGRGIDSGRKSIALSLILQDSSRTLTDEDVDTVVDRVASRLNESLGAQLRE